MIEKGIAIRQTYAHMHSEHCQEYEVAQRGEGGESNS